MKIQIPSEISIIDYRTMTNEKNLLLLMETNYFNMNR